MQEQASEEESKKSIDSAALLEEKDILEDRAIPKTFPLQSTQQKVQEEAKSANKSTQQFCTL